jgi:DNA-directed RNA polymerase specialized sigma24 family protein
MNTDFCQLFTREMTNLYLLCLLLTASPEAAEQCFISSLEDCLNGSAVAKEWAISWAKRVVVKNAIRLVSPDVHRIGGTAVSVASETPEELTKTLAMNPVIACVLALGDFDRLVFVMTVLERYSDHDAATLLDCTQQEIRARQIAALRQLAAFCARTVRQP